MKRNEEGSVSNVGSDKPSKRLKVNLEAISNDSERTVSGLAAINAKVVADSLLGNVSSVICCGIDTSISIESNDSGINPRSCNRLYLYVIQAVCIDTHRSSVHDCESCFPILHAFGRVGIALLRPIDVNIMESFPLHLRACSELKGKLFYLGEVDITDSHLLQMQRFHRAIVCWNVPETPPCSLDFKGSLDQLLNVEEWCESSNRAWYCAFPVAQWYDNENVYTVKRTVTVNDTYCSIEHPLKSSYQAALDKMIDSFPPPDWASYLIRAANEAELLVYNMSLHRAHSYTADTVHPVLPSLQFAEQCVDCNLPRKRMDGCSESVPACEFVGKLVRREYGRIHVGLDSRTTNTIVTLNTPCNVIKRRPPANSGSVGQPCKISTTNNIKDGEGNEPVVPQSRTIGEQLLHDYPHISVGELDRYMNEELIPMISMTGYCSLEMLLAPPLAVRPNVKNHQSVSINHKVSSPVSSSYQESVHDPPHRHADVQYYLPSTCEILGEAIWYHVGLIVPSLWWRLSSLALACELKDKLVCHTGGVDVVSTLKDNSIDQCCIANETDCKSSVDIKQALTTSTLIPHIEQQIDQIKHISTPLSVIQLLTAMTPPTADENIESTRLEFIGDAVLRFIVSVEAFKYYPTADSNVLSQLRIRNTSNSHLMSSAYAVELVQYLRPLQLSRGKLELQYPPSGMIVPKPTACNENIHSHDIPPPVSLRNQCIVLSVEDIVEYQQKQDTTHDQHVGVTVSSPTIVERHSNIQRNYRSRGKTKLTTGSAHQKQNQKQPSNNPSNISSLPAVSQYEHRVNTDKSMTAKGYYPALVQPKLLADFMEALIGVYHVCGCSYQEIHRLLTYFHCLSFPQHVTELDQSTVGEPIIVATSATGRTTNGSVCSVDSMCAAVCDSAIPDSSLKLLDYVDSIFHYRFNNYGLLYDIFNHSLPTHSIQCNRLEFIGDAVLEYVIMNAIMKRFELNDLTAGDLSLLRHCAVNIKLLRIIAVHYELHKLIKLHTSQVQLQQDIVSLPALDMMQYMSVFVKNAMKSGGYGSASALIPTLFDVTTAHQDSSLLLSPVTPAETIVAKCFRSVIGGIFVDSGYRVDIIAEIIELIRLVPYAVS